MGVIVGNPLKKTPSPREIQEELIVKGYREYIKAQETLSRSKMVNDLSFKTLAIEDKMINNIMSEKKFHNFRLLGTRLIRMTNISEYEHATFALRVTNIIDINGFLSDVESDKSEDLVEYESMDAMLWATTHDAVKGWKAKLMSTDARAIQITSFDQKKKGRF